MIEQIVLRHTNRTIKIPDIVRKGRKKKKKKAGSELCEKGIYLLLGADQNNSLRST